MIVEFTIENFRSFKEKHIFSLLAAKDREFTEQSTFSINNKFRFLKTAVLYGANASGKSNFFNALAFFLRFTVTSGPRKQAGDLIETEPFLFSKQTENAPSVFELIFYLDDKNEKNVRFRYGLSVNNKQVLCEYLYAVYHVREVNLFNRKNQEITFTSYFKEGIRARSSVRPNCTFLSVSAQNNGEIAARIITYFQNIMVTSGLSDLTSITLSNLNKKKFESKIVNFLKFADINIRNLKNEKIPLDFDRYQDSDFVEYLKKKIPNYQSAFEDSVSFGHVVYDGEDSVGEKYLPVEEESTGTQKLFSYSGSILNALEIGIPLFIDEFDAQLHPLIIESIIKLFNSPITNPRNAQLVISCHAVNILTNKIFRRDQIWFCEKDQYGATDLYSLVEYKEPVRKDASFDKDYLKGKYGAVPYIDNIVLQWKTD
jgi:AAA15 family ATPase/GTPase